MRHSLLGHLAFGFSKSPENLATEALCFILNRSSVANAAFIRLVSQTGALLPLNLRFVTQASGPNDEAIPDLVGLDINGEAVFIAEAKFWAGLTDNQPITYLEHLAKSSGSILLFIAPTKRFPTLWPELLRRCQESGMQPQQAVIVAKDFEVTYVDGHAILALASWRTIINSIQHPVESDNDIETLSDIKQLQGLCDRMDENAFLPIRSEELTSDFGARINQYCNLVDEVTGTLVGQGLASIQGLRATAMAGRYGRYMNIHQHGCMLQFNSQLWSSHRATPLWLSITHIEDKKWVYAAGAKERLMKLENGRAIAAN